MSKRGRTSGYVIPLEESLSAHVVPLSFTWSRALFGRYDVLQVHWPEYLMRHRRRPVAAAKRAAFRLLLRRLRWSDIAVVRTIHNVAAHDAGDAMENALLQDLDRVTTSYVVLLPSTTVPRGQTGRLIPHGHYRESAPASTSTIQAGRLLYFGIIKPYKGLEGLLAGFRALDDPQAQLRVVGKASASLAQSVASAQSADSRITSELRYVDDADLSEEIAQAELIVLPYTDLHNSGSLFRALSLDRPVLVPRNPVSESLADEIGVDWILTYADELTADTLSTAIVRVRARPAGSRPLLSGRSWDEVAAQYAEVYRESVASVD